MAYAKLDSPLPGLTVSPNGCHSCGMRGFLGDDSSDGLDLTTLPLAPSAPVDSETLAPLITPDNTGMVNQYPNTIGTEFISNGDGTYLNIQTGQSVPMATAQGITAATSGSATANLQPTSTQGSVTLTDPNTGTTSTIATNNLTPAAQTLNATGQLVTAAGKLTAQGAALLSAGNLYNAPPVAANPLTSLTSWLSGSTIMPGVPNALVAALLIGGIVFISAKKK